MGETSRRGLLKSAAAFLLDRWAGSPLWAAALHSAPVARVDRPKIIVVSCGGMRNAETFDRGGRGNIPHLANELLPQGLFYSAMCNAGVTSHFDAISSILTGNWQRVDDWGKVPPESPTLFEFLRKRENLPQSETWFVSSNKALTHRIGASSVRDFGPSYGANVIFPKQLLIQAVVQAAAQGRSASSVDRRAMQAEIESILNANNYEGLGWTVSDQGQTIETEAHQTVLKAIEDLVRTNAPVTGDEFTLLTSVEIMRRFAPSLLAITFSDMEAAHFGSYTMHVAGIRTLDRLIFELWNEVQANPAYRGNTTLFVLPEFGRDFDGSPTNGFFNHRFDNESTRRVWMLCMGVGAGKGEVVERTVYHTDVCATMARAFGITELPIAGKPLDEVKL